MSVGAKVSLRVEPGPLGLVMDHLDRAESLREIAAKRRDTRQSFRTPNPITMVCLRADEAVPYEAMTRNISSRGLSVLFGAFIYPQTACQIVLPTLSGGTLHVSGTLRWCRHVSRTIHEGGIEFAERIDVSSVVGGTSAQGGSEVQGAGVYRYIDQYATRVATLARDRRPFKEIREAFDQLWRAIEHEGSARSDEA